MQLPKIKVAFGSPSLRGFLKRLDTVLELAGARRLACQELKRQQQPTLLLTLRYAQARKSVPRGSGLAHRTFYVLRYGSLLV